MLCAGCRRCREAPPFPATLALMPAPSDALERNFRRGQRMVGRGVFFSSNKPGRPRRAEAVPGRQAAMRVPETHFVSGHRIVPPFPDGMQRALFGMGCFWGAERKFWQPPGVYATAVGYAGGFTPKPT